VASITGPQKPAPAGIRRFLQGIIFHGTMFKVSWIPTSY